MIKNNLLVVLLVMVAMAGTGCEVIGGLIEAGMVMGIIIVVVIIVIVLWLLRKIRK